MQLNAYNPGNRFSGLHRPETQRSSVPLSGRRTNYPRFAGYSDDFENRRLPKSPGPSDKVKNAFLAGVMLLGGFGLGIAYSSPNSNVTEPVDEPVAEPAEPVEEPVAEPVDEPPKALISDEELDEILAEAFDKPLEKPIPADEFADFFTFDTNEEVDRFFHPRTDHRDIVPVYSEAEELIMETLHDNLRGRPDLLRSLQNSVVEIKLYQGEGFCGKTYCAAGSTDLASVNFATEPVLNGIEGEYTGPGLVMHEFMHAIDRIEELNGNGLLPGLSEAQQEDYIEQRELEKPKILAGASPMDGYALKNDEEFLAVLAQVFFDKPQELKESNEALFDIMRDFFRLDPITGELHEPALENRTETVAYVPWSDGYDYRIGELELSDLYWS